MSNACIRNRSGSRILTRGGGLFFFTTHKNITVVGFKPIFAARHVHAPFAPPPLDPLHALQREWWRERHNILHLSVSVLVIMNTCLV